MAQRKIAKSNRGFKGVWIPSNIWLDHNLTIQEMIFLVEIDSLDISDDGCYASNKHFSEFFGLTNGRCSQIISNLQNKGYITISFIYGKNKEIDKRVIRVVRKLNTPIKFSKGGYLENAKGSNTLFSNTSNTISHSSEELKNDFEKLWKLYPRKKGKDAALKHYKKAIKSGSTNKQIQAGIMAYRKEIETQGIKEEFIKYGSTWFSNHGWEDEYTYSNDTKKSISDEIAESQRKIAEAYEQ